MDHSLSTKNHIGLVLAVLLGASDVASLAQLAGAQDSGAVGPPVAVLVLDGVLGVVTVLAAVAAWTRFHRRAAVRLGALARVLSAVTALPAFFVSGVPSGVVVLVAVFVLVTLVDVWLLLSRSRAEVAPASLPA